MRDGAILLANASSPAWIAKIALESRLARGYPSPEILRGGAGMDCWHRRAFLTTAVWLGGLAVAAAQEPSLTDTLKFGLKARRPIEVQFTTEIATLTDNGQLPKDYVLAVFDYSRTRRPKFPLPYFEFAIRKKAEELGVSITTPPLLTN
jgi:hypothetical protein